MLESLTIRNFALMENAELRLEPGFNVITGETGAGKSILINALSMVLGERVGRDIMRSGEESCEVQAVFEPTYEEKVKRFMSEHGLESGELIIRRIFDPSGRSKCYINDRAVTLLTVKRLGDMLVDIHSQNQHQALLDTSRQMELLDDYAGSESLLEETAGNWKECARLLREKENLIERQKKTREETERLRHEIGEIDSLDLYPGIEDEIEEEYRILSNAEALYGGAAELYSVLYESDGSVSETLSSAQMKSVELSDIDPSLKSVEEALGRAVLEIESASELLRGRLQEEETESPDRLDELQRRKNHIGILKRKYGNDISEIMDYRGRIGRQIEEFDTFEQTLDELETKTEEAEKRYRESSLKLLKERKSAGGELQKEVNDRLRRLGMPFAEFSISIDPVKTGSTGGSYVRFLIKTNPGSPVMDLKKVASGGEVSRIMLAIKAALAGSDDVPVLIFDEIDAGIGGDTAESVAEELLRLARYHLIISVTHLPQIAGRADAHFKVEKKTVGGSTFTQIRNLEPEDRVRELARMLGGEDKEMPLRHARKLIEKK